MSLLAAPPRIISGPDDFGVTVGDTIHVSCIIDGLPSPSITWATAEKTISPDDKYSVEVIDNTVTLVIRDATLLDTTAYTLTLENTVGTATFCVNVTVLGEDIMCARIRGSTHVHSPAWGDNILSKGAQPSRLRIRIRRCMGMLPHVSMFYLRVENLE